jgi:hypothetical protein
MSDPEEEETDGSGEPDDGWYDAKSKKMEEWLGPEHDMVMHALIPYGLGGALDFYYYPKGVAGTGIATKELSEAPGEGSSNDTFDCYELVMFTRHPVDLDDAKDESTPFGKIHESISAILNLIARYSAEATLNPGDTCEFPLEMEDVGGRCVLFDRYPSCDPEEKAEFGLMLVMEVFRSELEFARAEGTGNLFERLLEKGHYPYSDMDRDPVA